MINRLRSWLHRHPSWLAFREMGQEGYKNAWLRRSYQKRILSTPPMRTGHGGPVEIRVLTWRRDWMNLIWALKSFYHVAEVDYPLFIHDGGLLPHQADVLRHHFPDATLVPAAEADAKVVDIFTRRGLKRCLEYRLKNVSTRKLFDFFAFSEAEYLLVIDSDIVFFRKPELLLVPPGGVAVNRYNRDCDYWYSMELDELDEAFGIRPPDRINSGLALIKRDSIDFDDIERWLENPKLFENRWVTEQTIHALCSQVHGVELLPETYLVDTKPGLSPELVCKHYPGFFRTLLYQEGMAHLVRTGFLKALRSDPRAIKTS
ncbi:hypothetical protein ACYOEI_09685 [Singulisphaera rosea]